MQRFDMQHFAKPIRPTISLRHSYDFEELVTVYI